MISGTKIRLTLLGIFALGLILGAAADRLYRVKIEQESRPRRSERSGSGTRTLDTLTRRLNLRPDQIEKVQIILKEAGKEYVELRGKVRPRFNEIRNRQRERIRALLDQAQNESYSLLIQEWAQRRRHPQRRGNSNRRDR